MKSKIACPAAVWHCVIIALLFVVGKRRDPPWVLTKGADCCLNDTLLLCPQFPNQNCQRLHLIKLSPQPPGIRQVPIVITEVSKKGWLSCIFAHSHGRQGWFGLWWDLGFSHSIYWNKHLLEHHLSETLAYPFFQQEYEYWRGHTQGLKREWPVCLARSLWLISRILGAVGGGLSGNKPGESVVSCFS